MRTEIIERDGYKVYYRTVPTRGEVAKIDDRINKIAPTLQSHRIELERWTLLAMELIDKVEDEEGNVLTKEEAPDVAVTVIAMTMAKIKDEAVKNLVGVAKLEE